MADNEFHAIPRLSASGMYRVFACTASFTREWEAYDMRSRYGVPPPQPPQEALTGIQRHRLLSAIPFSSKKLGLGRPINLHDALKAEAGNLGIRFESAPDYWFCYNAILKRNRLISHVIEELGPARVERISINLDEKRLFRSVPLPGGRDAAEVSGLPDVSAQIRTRSGQCYAVICDYKSGWKDQAPATNNKQLLTLAHLLDHQEPLTACYVSLFAKTHSNNFIDAAYYDRPLLDQAAEVITLKTTQTAELQRSYRAEIPNALAERPLSGGLASRLDSASRVDIDHCLFCSGKVCCSKLRQQLADFKRHELEPRQHLVDGYRGIKRRMKLTKKHPQGAASMTIEELSFALAETRRVTDQIKLFTSLDKELSDLARETINNQNTIPGVKLEEGKQKFALKEGVAIVTVTDRLQKLVPSLDKSAFINQFGLLRLADVRAHLSEILAIPENKVIEQLQEILKDDNPFFMKPDQPSVVVDSAEILERANEDQGLEQSTNRI